MLQEKYERTRRIVMVLFAGKAGSGKTTAARHIYYRLKFAHPHMCMIVRGFATAFKDIAREGFGWDGKKDERGRRLLQILGTDAGRAYDPDLWVKKMEDFVLEGDYLPPSFVFADDWRFPNEKSYFDDKNLFEVVTVYIDRDVTLKGQLQEHISENSLPSPENDKKMYDFVIQNKDDLDSLYLKLNQVIDYLETKIV